MTERFSVWSLNLQFKRSHKIWWQVHSWNFWIISNYQRQKHPDAHGQRILAWKKQLFMFVSIWKKKSISFYPCMHHEQQTRLWEEENTLIYTVAHKDLVLNASSDVISLFTYIKIRICCIHIFIYEHILFHIEKAFSYWNNGMQIAPLSLNNHLDAKRDSTS